VHYDLLAPSTGCPTCHFPYCSASNTWFCEPFCSIRTELKECRQIHNDRIFGLTLTTKINEEFYGVHIATGLWSCLFVLDQVHVCKFVLIYYYRHTASPPLSDFLSFFLYFFLRWRRPNFITGLRSNVDTLCSLVPTDRGGFTSPRGSNPHHGTKGLSYNDRFIPLGNRITCRIR